MYIEQIEIENFGALAQCRVAGLSDGLSVIHGVNGAGKTTLMHFLSAVLCGFEQARRSRLIPPVKPGGAGGAVTIRDHAGRYQAIRHPRGDHSDTLAFSLLDGTADSLATIRRTVETLPRQLWSKLYAVTGAGAHDLSGLVQLAIDENVDLGARTNSAAWISSRVRQLESECAELFRTSPTQGTLVALEQKRDQLQKELEATRKTQLQQLESWHHSLQMLRQRIESLTSQGIWQDLELQAVETDLTECQDRLWSTRQSVVQDVETVQRPAVQVKQEWVEGVAEIDREIAHVQQVLRDLAASRMSLSVSKAALAGAEVPDLETVLRQQRNSLSRIESQTDQLSGILSQLQSAERCICGPVAEQLQLNVDEIRQQIWLICQEIGRQQATHQQNLLHAQREGVDRCEHELIKQIQRLRIRRDHLLQAHGRTAADRVHFRTLHEAHGCQCDGHEAAVANWHADVEEIPTAPQIVVRERTITTSAARPGDAALEQRLLAQRTALRTDRADTTAKLRTARLELQQLECAAREFAGDTSAQAVQNELVLIEQKLADAHEQWQSLTLLQTVLIRTQQKLNAEAIAPVIAETSQFLNRMTDGRYPRVRWNQAENELLVVNSSEGELPAQALSRGTLEQAVLCFRLALCREFQRRGIELPLILDDVLNDSDEDRLRGAADVLEEFARTHQVLFLTCQEHLVELLGSRGAALVTLPGSSLPFRQTQVETRTEAAAPLVSRQEARPVEVASFVGQDRIQPDAPFWLQFNSPIGQLPSLGEQMVRRLGALGVRSVGDLVELEVENADMPLDSLQISSVTLRHWQAEGRLLCCVPNLTGRDAQLLVLCQIFTPAELAACDLTVLLNRIEQLRVSRVNEHDTQWLVQRPEWPTQAQVERWIRSARSARSWRAARDWSNDRKIHRNPQSTRSRRRMLQPASVEETTSTVRFTAEPELETGDGDGEWKFYLRYDSPVVDAPSIGPRMAERLHALGIDQVSQLLAVSSNEISQRLKRKEVTPQVVLAWQQQARMMCNVPQLRGHDVQVLVACGVTSAEALAGMNPTRLFALVEPFVNSREGVRLLRSSRVPDLAEVTDWISFARQSPLVRAA